MNLTLSESMSRCKEGGYSLNSINNFIQSDKSCPLDTIYKSFLAIETASLIAQQPQTAAIFSIIGGFVKIIRNVYCYNQQTYLAILGESFTGLLASAARTAYFVNPFVEASNKWSPIAGILFAALSLEEDSAHQFSMEKDRWLKVLETAQNRNLTAIDEQIKNLKLFSFQSEGECNLLFQLVNQEGSEIQNNIMNVLDLNSINPNPLDIIGQTPLHIAILNEKNSFVEKLINHPRIDLELVNADGLTPLRLAFNRKLYFFVEMLVKKGANVNFISRSGQHMAHECYELDDLVMFNILSLGNLNSNAVNLNGKTIKERALEDNRLNWLT